MLKYNIFTTCGNCKALFISKSRTKGHVYCDYCRPQMVKVRYAKRKAYSQKRKEESN